MGKKRFIRKALTAGLAAVFVFCLGLVFSMSNSIQATAAAVPDYSWYGDGCATEFYVGTAEELLGLANIVNGMDGKTTTDFSGKTITLTDNIDLFQYGEDYNSGKGWIPIGNDANSFKGYFDGAGHVISGLYINDSSLDYAGLFGHVSCEILIGSYIINLGVENANIIANDYVGGIIGGTVSTGNKFVTNCYFKGTISGNSFVGGIVGFGSNAYVHNCYSEGSVSGHAYVGGICGFVAGSFDFVALNCYSVSNVSGNYYIGGICGAMHGYPGMSNCYSTGLVNGESSVGGIIGIVVEGSVFDCVALNPNVSGSTNIGRVIGKNDDASSLNNYAREDMLNHSNVADWHNKGHDDLDGEDINPLDAYAAALWTTDSNWSSDAWDDDIWVIEEGELPYLRNYTGFIEEIVEKEERINILTMSGWTYSETESDPSVGAVAESATVTYYYDTSSGGAFSSTNKPTNAGIYYVKAYIEESENYNELWTNTVSFTISKANFDMSNVKFEDKAFKYDGNSHNISVTGLSSDVDAVYVNNGKTEKGMYTVTVRFESTNENYNDPAQELTATMYINEMGIIPSAVTNDNFPFWIIIVALASLLLLLLLILVLLKRRKREEENKKVKIKVGNGAVHGFGLDNSIVGDEAYISKTFIVKNKKK